MRIIPSLKLPELSKSQNRHLKLPKFHPIKHKKKKPREKFGLKKYLDVAGIQIPSQTVIKIIFYLTILVTVFLTAIIIIQISASGATTVGTKYSTAWWAVLGYFFGLAILVWIFVFSAVFLLLWLFFFVFIDLKIFRRKSAIEEVLPDYLQLVSANIRAGMTIDRALWFAVRPRFGVLAHEIEIVAKQTISGEDLKVALKGFTEKYDSKTLRRSINMLTEGVDAGGEIGELLMKISDNISQTQLLKKEMAANVTTYAIFITVATIGAAPFLYALAGQLLKVIGSISANISTSDLESGPGGITIGLSSLGLTPTDYSIFAIVMLTMSSFFSAAIVSTIRSGEIKGGIRNVPIFMAITVTLYFILSWGFSKLFSGFF